MGEQLNRSDRRDPEEITHAVRTGGRIQRSTLDKLLELLEKKTAYPHWIAVEVQTSALLKTIDNEADALETIRRLEKKPAELCTFCGGMAQQPMVCPGCGRSGCEHCMPAGRGCLCPQCEFSQCDDSLGS